MSPSTAWVGAHDEYLCKLEMQVIKLPHLKVAGLGYPMGSNVCTISRPFVKVTSQLSNSHDR